MAVAATVVALQRHPAVAAFEARPLAPRAGHQHLFRHPGRAARRGRPRAACAPVRRPLAADGERTAAPRCGRRPACPRRIRVAGCRAAARSGAPCNHPVAAASGRRDRRESPRAAIHHRFRAQGDCARLRGRQPGGALHRRRGNPRRRPGAPRGKGGSEARRHCRSRDRGQDGKPDAHVRTGAGPRPRPAAWSWPPPARRSAGWRWSAAARTAGRRRCARGRCRSRREPPPPTRCARSRSNACSRSRPTPPGCWPTTIPSGCTRCGSGRGGCGRAWPSPCATCRAPRSSRSWSSSSGWRESWGSPATGTCSRARPWRHSPRRPRPTRRASRKSAACARGSRHGAAAARAAARAAVRSPRFQQLVLGVGRLCSAPAPAEAAPGGKRADGDPPRVKAFSRKVIERRHRRLVRRARACAPGTPEDAPRAAHRRQEASLRRRVLRPAAAGQARPRVHPGAGRPAGRPRSRQRRRDGRAPRNARHARRR